MANYYVDEQGNVVVTKSITMEAYRTLKALGYRIKFFF